MATDSALRYNDAQLPANLADVRGHLAEAVEIRLADFFAEEREFWLKVDPRASAPVDALADLIRSGGKRLRPAFCLAGYLAAGGGPEGHQGVVSAAAALEVLHACALIHDDVIDESAQRRGRPTVHAQHTALHRTEGWQGGSERFGESVALLAGDLALVYADRFMLEAPTSVSAVWNDLRTELIIGQYMDVVAAAEFTADPQLSRWVAVAKSGHYTIHRPLVVGATIAGSPELTSVFQEYGVAVGEAFQLRDDLMDVFGDSRVTGKPAGLDLDRNKMTLLMGLVMERDPQVRNMFLDHRCNREQLRRHLVDTGVRADVERHIDGLVEKGCQALADAPIDDAWRDELARMAHGVAHRDS